MDINALIAALKKQDFGTNDSQIVSSLMHPIEAINRGGEWFRHNVEQAKGGDPYDNANPLYGATTEERAQAGLNLAGLAQLGAMPTAPPSSGATLGMVIKPRLKRLNPKNPSTEFSLAHEIAQKNAALPVEQGGLGLPPNNTAMDRAKALGFDNEAYHQTDYPDIKRFLNNRLGQNTVNNASSKALENTSKIGHWFSEVPLSNSKKQHNFPGNITYPVLIKSDDPLELSYTSRLTDMLDDEGLKGVKENLKYDGNDSILINHDDETGLASRVVLNPKNIRSRFAAFDPKKKDSANILASILAGTTLASQFGNNNGNQ